MLYQNTKKGRLSGHTHRLVLPALAALLVGIFAAIVSQPVEAAGKLDGTRFGTTPSWSPGTEYDKVYDGDTNTFFDYLNGSGGYSGLDLGAGNAAPVSKIRFYPRGGFAGRMNGGKFQGSNTGTDSGFVDLHTITTTPNGEWNEVLISDTTPYRYLRYLSAPDGYGNVAEVEFYTGTSGYSLPTGWVETNIGSPNISGASGYLSGTYTLTANGPTIGWTWDKFYYVSQPLLSDGSIVVRLSGFTHNGTSPAKYGIMLREDLTTGAAKRNIALVLGSDGQLTFQYRTTEGGDTSYVTGPTGLNAPYWLKLTRVGNLFTGWGSATGADGSWTSIGSITLNLPFNLRAGMVANSGDDTSTDTASFDNVSLTDSRIRSPWANLDIGNPNKEGAATNANGLIRLSGNGPTIGWTWDKFHYVYQPFTGDGSITARLTEFTHNGTSPAKYGVLFRENLTTWSPARNVALLFGSDGNLSLQSRSTEGGDTAIVSGPAGQTAPKWLRLERTGNLFTASVSATGAAGSWTVIGSVTLNLSTSLYVGLAANSGDDNNLDTASFDNVTINILPVTLNFNWATAQLTATRQHYGLNGFQIFNPAVAGNTTYNSHLAHMKPGLVRYHSWEMMGSSANDNGWINPTTQTWDAAKVHAAMSALSYTNTEFIMNIPGWPASMDTNNDGYLDADKFDAYAQFCADLVRIVNIDYPGHRVTYWEPTNERDDLYFVNKNPDRLNELIDIYNRAARAMKAVDPTIKTGGLAFARPDLYTQVERFVQGTITQTNPATLDFLSYHGYASGSASDSDEHIYNRAYNPLNPSMNTLAKHTADIRAIVDEYSPNRRLPIFLDEYNISWTFETFDVRMRNHKGGVFDALVMVSTLNAGVDGTTAWNEKDGIYGKMDNDYTLRPSAHVFHLFNNYLVGQKVQSSQTITGAIVTMGVKDPSTGRRSVVVINRSPLEQKVKLNFTGWNATNVTFALHEVSAAGFITSTATMANLTSGDFTVPPDSVTVLTVIVPDGPVLASLQPASVLAGSAAFTLTVNGSNFAAGSTVRWQNTDLTTTFVSSTRLTAFVPASLITTPKSITVTVANSPSNVSNSLPFTVTDGLRVTQSLDRGAILDGDTPGTLSYALKRAQSGQTITFELGNSRVISVTGQLAVVPEGVIIQGRASCTDNQANVVLDGSNTPPGTHGLELSGGNTLIGITVRYFTGWQIKAKAKVNNLLCTEAIKK